MKKTLSIIFSLFLLTLFFLSADAKSQDIYNFKTTTQQTEFNDLLKNLRCLVCQNQDLSDSHAQFSEDLRKQIHQWITEGKSQKEILHILTSQYGDFILFQPPVKKTTYILWFAPFIIFLGAVVCLFMTVYARKKNNIYSIISTKNNHIKHETPSNHSQ